MQRRTVLSALVPVLVLPAAPGLRAQGLAGLTEAEATRGLRTALETGASTAVRLLGVQDGFLGNPKVRIPLPGALQDASKLLRNFGMGKQLDELEVSFNRAAESAVPLAKNLLVNAVRTMSVSDAKNILTGGDTSVTTFFADRTRTPLTAQFLPAVRQVVSKVGLAARYDRIAGKASGMGLLKPEDASVDQYVTRKSLDGLYLVIGEQERQLRQDPMRAGSEILRKVFGAMR